MKHEFSAAFVAAGLFLAQLTAPGSYNLGVPSVPGTHTLESNPATAVAPPASGSPSSPAAAGSAVNTAPASSAAPTGPAYSFGAAPAPTLSTGR